MKGCPCCEGYGDRLNHYLARRFDAVRAFKVQGQPLPSPLLVDEMFGPGPT